SAFGEGRSITEPDSVAVLAAPLGVDGEALRQAVNDPAIKGKLREETDRALARGVFGSPFIFVDDEPFWGHDRLPQVEHWLVNRRWGSGFASEFGCHKGKAAVVRQGMNEVEEQPHLREQVRTVVGIARAGV